MPCVVCGMPLCNTRTTRVMILLCLSYILHSYAHHPQAFSAHDIHFHCFCHIIPVDAVVWEPPCCAGYLCCSFVRALLLVLARMLLAYFPLSLESPIPVAKLAR